MKKLIVAILVVILILGLLWLLADLWSRKQLEEACEAWPLIDRSLADFSQVFPRTAKNQSAQTFEDLYGQVRLDIGADLDTEAEKSSQEEQNADQTMKSALREYLEKELARPTGRIEAPPADIVAVLTANKDVLTDIVHLLVSDDLPEWALDVEAEESPNLLWYLHLNRLLIVQALSLQANGKSEQAWSNLYAATRLADSMFTRPEVISQLIAIVEANQILVAMRKMPAPIPAWALRWPTHDLEHGMVMAYTREARYFLMTAGASFISTLQLMNPVYVEMGRETVPIGVKTHFLSVVARPYFRLCGTYTLVAWKRMIRDLLREGFCTDQPSRFRTLGEQLPSWVVSSWAAVGKILDADLSGFWGWERSFNNAFRYRFHRLMVYLTGTRSILAAKTAKAESSTGRWPETLPDTALPCKNLAWLYTVASDGSVTFHYSKPLPELYPEIPAGYLTYLGGAEE